MKITGIATLHLNLPMLIDTTRATPMQGGAARTSIDMLLVRVDTDAGVTGWGEAFGHRIFPATRAAIDTLLAPLCVGRDPRDIAALHDDLQRLLHGVGRNGPTMYALSGIDIALWDIAGKIAGQPLYRLLGGSPRADLPAYASLLRYGVAATVAHYTEDALGRGYRHIKLHEITVPEVKAARDRRAFEAGALTYAQPSVTKVGGVTEMRKVITLAETFGVPVIPHSAYFGPGLLASIHCIAAMPRESWVECYYCDFAENPLGGAIYPGKNGRIAVPQGPGLGVDPDPGLIDKLRKS